MEQLNIEVTPLLAPENLSDALRAMTDSLCFKLEICNLDGTVLLSQWLNQPPHLENYKESTSFLPLNGENQMAKINRTVIINGQKHWVRAANEQDYAEKVIALSGHIPASQTQNHLFKTYATQWLEIYSKPNVDASTAISYERTLKRHILPALGELYVEDITTADIQALFNKMAGAKTSKDKVKAVLTQIFGLALEDGIITKNPLASKRLKITGKKSVETKPYSVEQMRYLIDHMDSIKQAEDRTFLALLALHPLRLEEVLGLRYEDIDTEAMKIHIRRAVTHPDRNQPVIKDTKTEQSQRTIGLSTLALPYLGQDAPGAFVLGGDSPLSYTTVRNLCGRIKRDTGFEDKVTPKRFRTTVLTDIYEQTKDIKLAQAAAGHTTSAMTLKHYVKGRGELSSAATVIDELYSA